VIKQLVAELAEVRKCDEATEVAVPMRLIAVFVEWKPLNTQLELLESIIYLVMR
jgi:hypothetical protein